MRWDLPELPPHPTTPSRHGHHCIYRPENFFQLTVKPKVHCPSSSKCWEPMRGDGSMGFWALDTAVWYSPEKLPWLSTVDTSILEPRSFSHQPVRLHCWRMSRRVPGGCLHTAPTPTPWAEPPAHTPLMPTGSQHSPCSFLLAVSARGPATTWCWLPFPPLHWPFPPWGSQLPDRGSWKRKGTQRQAVGRGTAGCLQSPGSAQALIFKRHDLQRDIIYKLASISAMSGGPNTGVS